MTWVAARWQPTFQGEIQARGQLCPPQHPAARALAQRTDLAVPLQRIEVAAKKYTVTRLRTAQTAYAERWATRADYQRGAGQDMGSREGCGNLPSMLDVNELHVESSSYAERARGLLEAGDVSDWRKEEPAPTRSDLIR
jgi:hypothetical protein